MSDLTQPSSIIGFPQLGGALPASIPTCLGVPGGNKWDSTDMVTLILKSKFLSERKEVEVLLKRGHTYYSHGSLGSWKLLPAPEASWGERSVQW